MATWLTRCTRPSGCGYPRGSASRSGSRHAEITYTVGPIPVGYGLGKEVVSRVTTDIAGNCECFVYSKGREMLPHKEDWRQSWSFNQDGLLAGKFHPFTTGLFIRDQKSQLTF